MKKNLRFPQVLISWFKGILGSLNRWLKRLLLPKQGRRAKSISTSPMHSPPLLGIDKFRQAETLTVQELMAKVQWQFPKQAPKTVASVREQIDWD